MKLAKQVNYNFSDERLKRESAREFICQFLDPSQVDPILETAFELNISTEKAVAYALAMFNAIQDMFYFHWNMEFCGIEVRTTHISTPVKDRDRIFSYRAAMVEPYMTKRAWNMLRVIGHLKTQCKNKERLADVRVKIKNPEQLAKKKKARAKKKKAECAKRYYQKKVKWKKAWKKRCAWMIE